MNASTLNQTQMTSLTVSEGKKKAHRNEVSTAQCAEWVKQAKQGDRDAWDKIVDTFHPRIYHYLVSFMGNPHDAQDVAQDTFVKVYRKLHQHREGSSFTSWIFTVARRTALNHFRDTKVGEELPENLTSQSDSPSENAVYADDSNILWTCVQDMKPAARQALWLRYGDGLKVQEIAEIMGKTSLYVRVLIHRAKSDLAKRMRTQY